MSSLQFAIVVILLGIDTVKDIKYREIPDWVSIAIYLTAFLNFDIHNLWGLIVAAVFFLVALVTKEIGGGDVKLMAALSVVCGFEGSFVLLFFAQIFMLIFYGVFAIVQKLRGRTAEKSLPFVPFILLGYLCSKLIF